jgi:hypothetical protein
MRGLALCTIALGLLLAMAAPSMAENYYVGSVVPWQHYHHGYYGPRVVVSPVPVYGYAAYPGYPPVVAPPYVVPAPAVVGPAPYYYYGRPAVTFGYRGGGIAVGVGF